MYISIFVCLFVCLFIMSVETSRSGLQNIPCGDQGTDHNPPNIPSLCREIPRDHSKVQRGLRLSYRTVGDHPDTADEIGGASPADSLAQRPPSHFASHQNPGSLGATAALDCWRAWSLIKLSCLWLRQWLVAAFLLLGALRRCFYH